MRALLVSARPCEAVARIGAEGYVGFKIIGCSMVEHALLKGGRVVRVSRRCEECVFGRLVRASLVIGRPSLTPRGLMKFVVADTREARRVLRESVGQVVSVEEVDVRGVVLSQRQAEALSLMADGAGGVAGVARALGISKVAAWKLVKKGLRKLALAVA